MDESDSKKKDEKSKTVASEDVNWSGGIAKHGCTDIICLLLFIAFLVVWGFVGTYAMMNGDIDRVGHENYNYVIYFHTKT